MATEKEKEQAVWLFAWKKKIDDISCMWAGSCTAYTKQGETHIAELKKLCKKIAKTI